MNGAARVLAATEKLALAMSEMIEAWEQAEGEGDDHNARASIFHFPFSMGLDDQHAELMEYLQMLRAEAEAKKARP